LIRRYATDESVFLEIGCGDMSLRRFVPGRLWYNAMDLELSEFHLRRVLRGTHKVNLALACAAQIPIRSDTVSLIVATETLEHIPDIDAALREIHRIARADGVLICTIPNNYGNKYVKKGPHPGHVNNWTYEGFLACMKSHRFVLVEGFMKGRWVPLPLWLTRTSYHLSLSSPSEYHNTNFFYVFRAGK